MLINCEEEKARLKRENQLLKQQIAVDGLVAGARGYAIGQTEQASVTQQSSRRHKVLIVDLRKEIQELRKENQELKSL